MWGLLREVASCAYLLELPLPFSLGKINVYLVRLEDGYLLVDCGMATEGCLAALEGALESLGVPWDAIRQILLTHLHPDHMGLAPRLLRSTGARLLMHGEDAAFLGQLATGGAYRLRVYKVLTAAGVPDGLRSEIEVSLSEIEKNFQKLDPDWVLAGGETIPAAMGTLHVVWTPGHSPGHICLYCPEQRVLFSGDHMLERITPNIGWHPGRDALAEFLASLDRLLPLEIELVLPSHGAPFSDHRGWIRNTIRHHQERCDRILASLRGVPKTAHELVSDLWEGELPPLHHRFAVFEVLSHLEYLERRGRLAARDISGAIRWKVSDSA